MYVKQFYTLVTLLVVLIVVVTACLFLMLNQQFQLYDRFLNVFPENDKMAIKSTKGVFSGSVLAKSFGDNRNPIPMAQLIFTSDSGIERKTYSEYNGSFIIYLDEGTYSVTARHPDHETLSYAEPIAVTIDKTTSLDFTMIPKEKEHHEIIRDPSGFSGVIYSKEDDSEIEGAQITFISEEGKETVVYSGISGGYQVSLPPGRYKTILQHPDYIQEPMSEFGWNVVQKSRVGTYNVWLNPSRKHE